MIELLLLATAGGVDLIFADGFESGDLRRWSVVVPAPQASCLTLTAAELASPEIECSFSAPGIYPLQLEACNELGCDQVVRLVEVLDPGSHGACCLVDGSCRLTMASECSFFQGEWNGYGTRCRSVACQAPPAPPPPPPVPIYEAQGCLLGFCVFAAGTTVSFRQEHLQPPFRYGFENPTPDTCAAPVTSSAPITAYTYRTPGAFYPCLRATDLAGEPVVLFNPRPISIFEE